MKRTKNHTLFNGRALLILTLLVGLFLRGLTPAGYMFVVPANGDGVVIKICSGLETRYAVMNPETGNITEIDIEKYSSDQNHEPLPSDPCPFGLLSLIDLPSTEDIVLPLPQAPPSLRTPPIKAFIKSALRAPHAPRAPPKARLSTHH